MNPPNTAQIVKTRLLDKVLPSESLLSLSVTLGILNLNILQENEYCQALVQSPKSKVETQRTCTWADTRITWDTTTWPEEVRTSRWTSRWTSKWTSKWTLSQTTGNTSGSLKFSDGLRRG